MSKSPTANYGSKLPLSPTAVAADLPLRAPIDIEFKLNHKLAKQLYEKELQDKVRINKEA
jgi:hypothetical protein